MKPGLRKGFRSRVERASELESRTEERAADRAASGLGSIEVRRGRTEGSPGPGGTDGARVLCGALAVPLALVGGRVCGVQSGVFQDEVEVQDLGLVTKRT